jgi:hypothetical protein
VTGGGAVKTVPARPGSPAAAPAWRGGGYYVIRSRSRLKGLCVDRLRIIRRYITVYHQTIQPARATEHTVWYFGFPIRPPAAARVRSADLLRYCPRALLRSGQVWCQPTTASYSWHAVTDSCCGTANVHGAARKRSSARCVPTLCMHWAERRSTDGDDARERRSG